MSSIVAHIYAQQLNVEVAELFVELERNIRAAINTS